MNKHSQHIFLEISCYLSCHYVLLCKSNFFSPFYSLIEFFFHCNTLLSLPYLMFSLQYCAFFHFVLNIIWITHIKYVKEHLERFCTVHCKASLPPLQDGLQLIFNFDSQPTGQTLYKKSISSLTYLANTKHDLGFVVGLVASLYLSK